MKLAPATPADVIARLGCGSMTTRDGVIQTMNSTLIAWCGDAVGSRWSDIMSAGAATYWELAIQPLLAKQGHAADVAIELKTRSTLVFASELAGETTWLFVPLTERQRYASLLAAAERRAAESEAELRRLRDLDRMRQDFVNAVAHEIATPMTPIKIQLAMMEKWADERMAGALRKVRANVDHLQHFLDSLEEAAAIQAHTLGTKRERLALDVIAQSVVLDWQKKTERRVDFDAVRTHVAADTEAIMRCLQHVLDNAARFSAPDSTISVTVHHRPARIEIRDEGRGIDPDRIGSLGKAFVKAHDDADFAGLGAGLGLYVVNGLMEAMGGRLEITSEGAGRGTKVQLVFPSARDRRPR